MRIWYLFDQAKPAVGGGRDVGVIAQRGDVDPQLGGGMVDGGAGGHGDWATVDGERNSVLRCRHR